MTALLLDTNVLIAAGRGAFDLDRMIADDDEPAIAAITVAELGVGVELASGRRRTNRRAFLDDVLATLQVIDYGVDVARAHTALLVAVRSAGRPRGAHDLIIAATARATNRTVVTFDRAGFADLPGVLVRASD
ncbi:MAG: PIN domain-containing protein [Actinobacteria bacterium]|nr:PIN domain-containing protein [Actinomycetota bacterium]MSW79457.1 PIN domain-containing protein [Actinomycetota bacterium]MSX55177.1 PIN domain-containing protein [Actinomycetota bacterium]MSZ84556.1 PIN domain-containing protein [Actinomycetota bacterium]MTB19563.1 PIN domain-containing protein [Actinomycetota bacterium]